MNKVLCLLSISALMLSSTSYANSYFLTIQQKKELILRGQMHDQEQRLYDIWLVPGYVVPSKQVNKGWRNASEALQHYGEATFYRDIKKYSNETWRYGYKTILNKYTVTGTQKAWQNDMATARQRTEKRVFAWWLAYPWGVFEATTESVFRLATGIPVGIAVSASAYTAVPTLTLTWPVVESVGFATIQGTAYPVVASTWNTVIAPPLALLGQQPAPERADGFWMKQVDDPNLETFVKVFKQWQKNIGEKPKESEQIQQYEQQIAQLHEQINHLQQLKQQAEKQNQEAYTTELLLQAQQQKAQLAAELAAKNLSLSILARNRQALQTKLLDSTWSYSQLQQVLDSLLENDSQLERTTDDKTDPLQRSLDLIKP